MKKVIVMCMLVSLLFVGGCLETLALVWSGAVGGMTAQSVLQQQEDALEANIVVMKQQKVALEAELAEAADEAERKRILERIDNTDTVLEELRITKEAVAKVKEGLGVDWKDPKVVIPFASSLVLLIFEELQRRRKKEAEEEAEENYTALTEVVKGGQEFKRVIKANGGKGSAEEFGAAMGDAQSPETKRLVAVIKV